jgi:hypothetical protein
MPASVLRFIIAAFLIAHGLIYYSLTTVPLPKPGEMRTPFWPSLSRSGIDERWLSIRVGLSRDPVRIIGWLLVMIATVGFILVGLGILGVPGLKAIWQPIAIIAAVDSLLLFALYWHAWLFVGAGINIAVLLAVWQSWPALLFVAR